MNYRITNSTEVDISINAFGRSMSFPAHSETVVSNAVHDRVMSIYKNVLHSVKTDEAPLEEVEEQDEPVATKSNKKGKAEKEQDEPVATKSNKKGKAEKEQDEPVADDVKEEMVSAPKAKNKK